MHLHVQTCWLVQKHSKIVTYDHFLIHGHGSVTNLLEGSGQEVHEGPQLIFLVVHGDDVSGLEAFGIPPS